MERKYLTFTPTKIIKQLKKAHLKSLLFIKRN